MKLLSPNIRIDIKAYRWVRALGVRAARYKAVRIIAETIIIGIDKWYVSALPNQNAGAAIAAESWGWLVAEITQFLRGWHRSQCHEKTIWHQFWIMARQLKGMLPIYLDPRWMVPAPSPALAEIVT